MSRGAAADRFSSAGRYDRYHPDRLCCYRPTGAGQPVAPAGPAAVDTLRGLACLGRNCYRRYRQPPLRVPSGKYCQRCRKLASRFRAQRRIAPLCFSARAAVRGGAQCRRAPAQRRGRTRSPSSRHRRDRLHLCRRVRLVAYCPGRDPGMHHSGRDHRDHRPGCGGGDLPRHRGAAPLVDLGAGREPVQRRRGNRDLLAGCRDAGRRSAREPVGRAHHLCAPIRRWSRRRTCCRLGCHPVPPDLAREPIGRGDPYDRLLLCDLRRLRSLPRRLGCRRGRRRGAGL